MSMRGCCIDLDQQAMPGAPDARRRTSPARKMCVGPKTCATPKTCARPLPPKPGDKCLTRRAATRTPRLLCRGLALANAPVAQLDRALDYESRGQRFESFRARHSRSKLGTSASQDATRPFRTLRTTVWRPTKTSDTKCRSHARRNCALVSRSRPLASVAIGSTRIDTVEPDGARIQFEFQDTLNV